MKVTNSPFYNLILETYLCDTGTFYFFKNVVIAEIKNGAHVDLKSSKSFFEATNSFYNNGKPFVYLSNRINKFSVAPLDFAKYSSELDSVEAFCAIVYNSFFDEINVEIEKRFSHKPFYIAQNLEDAFNWSNSIINDTNRSLTA